MCGELALQYGNRGTPNTEGKWSTMGGPMARLQGENLPLVHACTDRYIQCSIWRDILDAQLSQVRGDEGTKRD
ncbi:MAG: hypothetical protein RML15_07365 [Bacteroidota bacterium]|nr:hypothetical protein [Bacteroidota bacterium]